MKNHIHYIQSFINNVSVPRSLEELQSYIEDNKGYDIEDVLYEDATIWTTPRWCKTGDIVFFMHAKCASRHLYNIRKELECEKDYLTENEYEVCNFWIDKGLWLQKMFGGKIIAIAKVTDNPEQWERYEEDSILHWKSRIYAPMKVTHLENPIDISEFRDFIKISMQSAITGVFGNEFEKLMKIIANKNKIPKYFTECEAAPMPISKICKENYLQITSQYRRAFMLEIQFRTFYTDYLLSDIGDQKTIYSECLCHKENNPNTYVDNVILFSGKYLPVEIKLNINNETYLEEQLRQYINLDYINNKGRIIYPNNLYNNHVLVIDTENICLYDGIRRTLKNIMRLDDVKSKNDIENIKKKIVEEIKNCHPQKMI